MSEASGSGYLMPKEVAELLHVSPQTVARWAMQQKLPYMRTLGGHRRFPADQIGQLVQRLEAAGGSIDIAQLLETLN
ncbi:MAG: hypothetical protein NVSMB32_14010 [Actinomycetota bacterium]